MVIRLKYGTTIFIYCLATLLIVVNATAQTYPTTTIFNASTINTLQLYTSTNTIWGRDTLYYWNTPNNHGNIGYLQTDHWMTIDGQQWNFYEQEKNRSVLTISFSGSTIPADATINGIQIGLSSATNGSLTATIGKLADGNITTNKAGWDKFTSGSNTIYNSNINYNTPTPVNITQDSPLWNAVISALSAKTTMPIFARSNSESNGTSNATISVAIYVLWTPKISVTVQNNVATSPSFVIIDGISYTSPKTVTWDAGSPHTLQANNQTGGGLVYPFIDWRNITAGKL